MPVIAANPALLAGFFMCKSRCGNSSPSHHDHLLHRGFEIIAPAPPNDYTTSSLLRSAMSIAFMSVLLACSKLVC